MPIGSSGEEVQEINTCESWERDVDFWVVNV